MTRSDFSFDIGVEGTGEALRQFSALENAQKGLADTASTGGRRWSESLDTIGHGIKNVGKDLDNLGLDAGKSFAMTTEGALSVVAALGAGGVAGAVGAVTVVLGYAVQAWKSYNDEQVAAKKAAEDHKKAEEDRWKAALEGAKKAREEQKKKSTADLEDIANARQTQVILLQKDRATIKARILLTKAGSDERNELRRQEADNLVALTKAESERVEAVERARVSKNRDLTREVNQIRAEESAARAEAIRKREAEEAKRAEEAAKKTLEQQEAILKARDAAREEGLGDDGASERAKRDDEEIARLKEFVAGTDAAAYAVALRRDAERELAEAIQQRRDQDTQAIVVQAAMSAETMAYGVAMSVVQPMVQDFTASLAVLGTINRENYRDLIIFSNELPAIIAREVQARLGAMGAEATGKAIMSSADGLRETAIGFGMLFVNPADAAAHFTAAGVHFAAASAYGTLGTGALVGAGAIGSLRGAGGPIALTSEEQDTINMRRDEESGSWVPTSSGGSGSMGGDDGAFVVNITNEAGSIAPDDQRRAARVVASSVLRARSNAFDRRRMGA